MNKDGKVLIEQIGEMVNLPSIPSILAKIQEVVQAPDSSSSEVADIILQDPATTLKVLRIANSAYYGLKCEVSSVTQAVTLLGFKVIRNIVFSAAVHDKFKHISSNPHFSMLKFWRHSVCCAVAAKAIGTNTSLEEDLENEDLYICGLLHDIGKIIMLDCVKGKYTPILQEANEPTLPLHEVETGKLGFNHAYVGALLANKWNIPDKVSHLIRFHHEPDNVMDVYGFGSIMCLADRLAKGIEKAPGAEDTLVDDTTAFALDRMGLERDIVEPLMEEVSQKFRKIQMPFG